MNIQGWATEKLVEISKKLPTLVHSEPASFACGFNVGYKQAMLDLISMIEILKKDNDDKN